jgi:hypothetical protein
VTDAERWRALRDYVNRMAAGDETVRASFGPAEDPAGRALYGGRVNAARDVLLEMTRLEGQ